MSRFKSSLLAAAALTVGLLQAAPASVQSSDETQIRALLARIVEAVNTANVDGIMSGYVPGEELFVFDLGLPRQHSGWAAYKKDWQDFFGILRGPPKLDVRDLKLTVLGTTAYSHCIQHVSWINQDGSPTELNASVTDVYRKTHGRWLIVLEHLSVPIHLSTGQAEMGADRP